ncbi:peptidase S11 D-alanyl-D-alanine carboxypeptidase 1 [Paenibacillus curdlanolyticus YK9]|uniref:Peptidase S11 D-alanyl-D-alanine carboxypeptidase 1 n=2 Tax=Paenibacillus curdlanolyticus TaxID=59840 RepID=E0IBY0_9BACL|nr:peptidase S11 D-alanyl-D-alanine carboxypeptidase 1 [Paenibacillus curdlanolyticus YK9]
MLIAVFAVLLVFPPAASAAGESTAIAKDLASAGEQTALARKPPELLAESAILMDRRTGTILYEKNASQRMYPASITKIVTAIVALESANVEDVVTVSKEARGEEGTRVYLEEGEQMKLWQLLLGMMVNSGNDAATAIAEHVDGSKEKFAEHMNAWIREKANAYDSQFRNPSGLPDPEHYTTAEDMAKITQYAMSNEKFRELVGTKKVIWNGQTWQTVLVNHNKLLGTYDGATGVKNGYTTLAGSTLVASAERNGMELIGVILKAPSSNQMYADMRSILDYGFAAFEPKLLFDENETYEMDGAPAVAYTADEAIWTVVPKGEKPKVMVDATGVVHVMTSQGVSNAGRFRLWKTTDKVSALSASNGRTASAETAPAEHASGESEAVVKTIAGACIVLALGGVVVYGLRRRNRITPSG